MGLVVLLVLIGLGAWWTGKIAERKGYNFRTWCALGVLFGFVMLPVAALMRDNEGGLVSSGQRRRCPFCLELIRGRCCVGTAAATCPPAKQPTWQMYSATSMRKGALAQGVADALGLPALIVEDALEALLRRKLAFQPPKELWQLTRKGSRFYSHIG